jgi:hypothetical protein
MVVKWHWLVSSLKFEVSSSGCCGIRAAMPGCGCAKGGPVGQGAALRAGCRDGRLGGMGLGSGSGQAVWGVDSAGWVGVGMVVVMGVGVGKTQAVGAKSAGRVGRSVLAWGAGTVAPGRGRMDGDSGKDRMVNACNGRGSMPYSAQAYQLEPSHRTLGRKAVQVRAVLPPPPPPGPEN